MVKEDGEELNPEPVDLDRENPENYFDLVYELKRMNQKNSPLCIIAPSNEILFKMMRACIGVYSEDDLWFN
jgi:hypothetical protein